MGVDRLSNQLRRYRLKCGYRVKDVAYLVGHKTSAHISRYESGRRLPSLRTALELSAALRCPVEILFHRMFADLREEVIGRRTNLELPPDQRQED